MDYRTGTIAEKTNSPKYHQNYRKYIEEIVHDIVFK